MKIKGFLGLAVLFPILLIGSLWLSQHKTLFQKDKPQLSKTMEQPHEAQPVAVPIEPEQEAADESSYALDGVMDCPADFQERSDLRPIVELPKEPCLSDIISLDQAPAPFQSDSSQSTLQATCGPVFVDFLVHVGEGQCQWVSSMFHGTGREVMVSWKNWEERKGPTRIRFIGKAFHFSNGLKLGIPLTELTALNGKAIELAGFGWDGAGVHRSFQGGALQIFDAPKSPFFIQYGFDRSLYQAATPAERESITQGETSIESTLPALETVKAQVKYVEYNFPVTGQGT